MDPFLEYALWLTCNDLKDLWLPAFESGKLTTWASSAHLNYALTAVKSPAALKTLIDTVQPTELDTLVFLGDYIDRGPDSRGVLEQIIALGERCTVVPLMGNHEEMLLAVLEGGQSEIKFWLTFGGIAALASYGWKGGTDLRPADVRSLIPKEHIEFVKGCRDHFEIDRHVGETFALIGIDDFLPRLLQIIFVHGRV